MRKYGTALGKYPKVLVVNTDKGAFIRANSHRFQAGTGDITQGIRIEGCSYIMTAYGQDCLGPIPQFTYIRVMERIWVWVSTDPRPEAGEIPPAPAGMEPWLEEAPPLITPPPPEALPRAGKLFVELPHGELPTQPNTPEDGKAREGKAAEKAPALGAAQDKPGPEASVPLPSEIVVPQATLDERTDIQYQKVPLLAERLTKRRRELRKLDLKNFRADSSDDSIDEYMASNVLSGIRPRKRRNVRNNNNKLPTGALKRLYVLSDSERDEEGHDPSGGVRVRKRIKLSNSEQNYSLYAHRGLAMGRQSRDLIRPDNSLLYVPMENKQMQNYQTYCSKRLRSARVLIVCKDKEEKVLEKRIFEGGYQRIVRYLSEELFSEEVDKLWYSTRRGEHMKPFSSEDAYLDFCKDLKNLPKEEREGAIIITVEDKIPIHEVNLVVEKKAYPVPRKLWIESEEAIRGYFISSGILKNVVSFFYEYQKVGDEEKPPKNIYNSLLDPGAPRKVTIRPQESITVYRFLIVIMGYLKLPDTPVQILPADQRTIVDLYEYSDVASFAQRCAKGTKWEKWAPEQLIPDFVQYHIPSSVDEPFKFDTLLPFGQGQLKSLKQMVSMPKAGIRIYMFKLYEDTNTVCYPRGHDPLQPRKSLTFF